MPDFAATLTSKLERLRAADLYRDPVQLDSPQGPEVDIAGTRFVNFASNDYLGLATHPALVEAATSTLTDHGVGAGASRLICGGLRPHRELEEALADFKSSPAALTFATGYAAATGAICALLGKDDILIVDKLIHACVVDAARLSGARLRVFHHNDLADLEKKLAWAAARHPQSRCLIATESVFSMDGDLAPLLNIVELKERYGAWLMVDEAHATGLFGENRSGLVEEFGLRGRVEIQLVTLGKALGASGGAICGSRELIDLLINRARPYIFSTAPSPALAAAARAAIEVVRSPEGQERRQRLWAMVDHLKSTLIATQHPPGIVRSPIIPLTLGQESAALQAAADLRARSVLVPAIRYPTVARGAARLRFAISAAHTLGHLEILRQALSPDDTLATDEQIRPA